MHAGDSPTIRHHDRARRRGRCLEPPPRGRTGRVIRGPRRESPLRRQIACRTARTRVAQPGDRRQCPGGAAGADALDRPRAADAAGPRRRVPLTGPSPPRARIGVTGVSEVKVPAWTSIVSPTFTSERMRTQPNSWTLAQSPSTFSSTPVVGVSNATLDESLKSRRSLSFL